MKPVELRDSDQARSFVQQGLWLQKVTPPRPERVREILDWALEIAGTGRPLPPVGLVADLGHRALRLDDRPKTPASDDDELPGLPPALARMYEDYVVGKLMADATFERAGDALRRYAPGREQARGLAFLVNQFRDRADCGGVLLSPNVLKTLQREGAEHTLAAGRRQLQTDGPLPLLIELYTAASTSARWLAEMLAPEDVFELEHRTALEEMGQRVALRQVLRAAEQFESALPRHRPRPRLGRQEVPTRVLDEDTYPVGGFSSLSTRGSIESLLHSQLAFMEKEKEARPDLFDIKFLRDELLYYSRDDNQFLRRRRAFFLVLCPDLVQTRFKNPESPYQGIILVLALVTVLVRKLSEWLCSDALTFDLVFVTGDAAPLADERKLLETLLREAKANGTARLFTATSLAQVAQRCGQAAQRHLCHALTLSVGPTALEAADTRVCSLRLAKGGPKLAGAEVEPLGIETHDGLEDWHAITWTMLQEWLA